MTTATGPLAVRDEGGIRRLILNRPDKRNALNAELIAALKAGLRNADGDDAVRVVVIEGAGKDFCSGADLSALRKIAESNVMENLEDVEGLAELFLLPRRMRKPVVALVRGRALAGGCGLATACDLVLASESAQFGYPEVRIGFVPAMVMAILRRNVGEKRAFELIVRGQPIDAAEAERIGLINRVFFDDAFDAEAAAVLALCAEAGLRVVEAGPRGSSGEAWRSSFVRAPYLREQLVLLGVLVETFETACTWDRLEELVDGVRTAVTAALAEVCGGGTVTCRLTHVYPDGAAPYFTVLAPARRGSEVEQWDAVKAAVSEVLIAAGGTITHHHAVGRDHRPWYDQQRPDAFAAALAGAKRAVDPHGILNPGVLLDAA